MIFSVDHCNKLRVRRLSSRYARLDRYLSSQLRISRKAIKPLLAAGRVRVDGQRALDAALRIGPFSGVALDGRVLQANSPQYLMLHKPVGVLSATRDDRHTTAIDLLKSAGLDLDYANLHIAGRLDINSSGLLLLTNDGSWSRRLSAPENGICKRYHVTLANPITEACVQAFAAGIYLAYEDITTRPAKLQLLSERVAEVWLVEGRYHQIKRMFGRFRNPVLHLHRMGIGQMLLDPQLLPGQARFLTDDEVNGLTGDNRPLP